jgi:hypothetical protein
VPFEYIPSTRFANNRLADDIAIRAKVYVNGSLSTSEGDMVFEVVCLATIHD